MTSNDQRYQELAERLQRSQIQCDRLLEALRAFVEVTARMAYLGTLRDVREKAMAAIEEANLAHDDEMAEMSSVWREHGQDS